MIHPNHDIQFTSATFASSVDAANTTGWTYHSRSDVDGWYGVTAPSYPRQAVFLMGFRLALPAQDGMPSCLLGIPWPAQKYSKTRETR